MFPSLNPRDLRNAMKRLGIKEEEIPAKEVIIKKEGKNIIIRQPRIIRINMGGEESLQISGVMEEQAISEIREEDIQTVAGQANCSHEEARKALEECEGDLAKAIIRLTG